MQNEKNIDVETAEALDKMQKLEEKVNFIQDAKFVYLQIYFYCKPINLKKGKKYFEKISKLNEKRISLAYDLTDTLDDIEQQSGIFLIKPLYSYKGK